MNNSMILLPKEHVSSSGHLELAQALFGNQNNADFGA
jgi:hypothetical protein